MTRAAELAAYAAETACCERCPLAATRGQVVFGAGDPDAQLLLVGEAPGYHEDQGGEPFAGQTGELLERLLAGIGLASRRGLPRERAQVPAAAEPRPPRGRDRRLRAASLPSDRADPPACRRHPGQLRDEASLGPPVRDHEGARAGARGHARRSATVVLYPLYHPAAALYTPSMLRALEEDFARIPALLGRPAPEPRPLPAREPEPVPEPAQREEPVRGAVQLGLF